MDEVGDWVSTKATYHGLDFGAIFLIGESGQEKQLMENQVGVV